jgi:tetratricopeptide (TPR) repeat protein
VRLARLLSSARRLAPVLALGAACAACAPTYGEAYLEAMAAGHRAYNAGRYAEAATAYDDAAAKALRVKDRDEARFLQARTYERAEEWQQASSTYRRLAKDSPRGPRTVRAEFELADLEIAHGDAALGWRMLAEAARRNPAHGLARHAVVRLAQHAAEAGGGEHAAEAWQRAARPTSDGTDLEQVIEYEIAASLERQQRLPEARDAFLVTARAHPYPFGGLTDDAFWHAAEIEAKLGQHQRAIALLRELLRGRESPSHTVGSYERPRFSQAQMRIAEITRDGLRDIPRARAEFRRVFTDHPTSILRDDALWAEALLARDAGDGAAACRAMSLLVDDLPESRYVRCSRLLCATTKVPEAKADAPASRRECPTYLAEQAAGRPPEGAP